MSQVKAIEQLIRQMRPHARFVAVTHSGDFAPKDGSAGETYHYISLDDENVNSSLIYNKKYGVIMIHNHYLSSFSYNLVLCWLLYGKLVDDENDGPILTGLLKYNLKKYFAEQLLLVNNNVFSRAIFLETLLYEQFQMVPVIAARSENAELGKNADLGANLVLSLLSFHELGHFKFRTPQLWEQLVEVRPNILQTVSARVEKNYPAEFAEEFRCDCFAVICCFDQFAPEMGKAFCLRLIVFAFASYAVMSSLTKSAKLTASEQKKVPDTIDLNDAEPPRHKFEYSIGRDIDFIERARLVIELCNMIAREEKINLFDQDGPFPLSADILDNLLSYLDKVMETDGVNARHLTRLVAESFHGHQEAFNYLKLRSKVTRFGEGRNSDGTLREEQPL